MSQVSLSISNFRRFIFHYLVPFLAMTVILLLLFTYLFEQKIILGSDIAGAYKVNRILNRGNDSEVAIIGSSRAQGGYIPDSICANAFNYGIDGTDINIHLMFLQRELMKHKSTPVIMNIEMEGFGYANGDPGNYLYNSTDPMVIEATKVHFSGIRRIPGIKYYGYFETYLKYYLNNKTNITKVTNKGGSFELNREDTTQFRMNVNRRLMWPAFFVHEGNLEKKLENLISTYPGRKIYLVIPPYHSSFTSTFLNKADFNGFLQYFDRYPNVRVIDFSEMKLADDCFYNTTHLNYKGAGIFSRALRDTLSF